MTLQEYKYLEEIKFHYKQTQILENKISNLPKGCLVKHKNGKYTSLYHHIYVKGKQSRIYLSPKKDQALIAALQKKHEQLPNLSHELSFHKNAFKAMKIYGRKLIKNAILPDPDPKPFFSQNKKEPKELKYTTNKGEKVRSKSEKIIADLLYEYKIDYKYEKSLKLAYYNPIFPDFTIKSPLNGLTYYWEHNGLNTEEYLRKWRSKKQIYEHSNINTDNFLLVTTEEDIDNTREIIETNFTLKRYSFLFS